MMAISKPPTIHEEITVRSTLRSSFGLIVSALLLLGTVALPANAGVGEMALKLAGPLAGQFGVPVDAVTALLKGGISLESVTELLLVSQSSGKDLNDVTKLYRESGDQIGKTAEQLDVAESAYSTDKVNAAIDGAKQELQADAAKEATKAIGSGLGGLGR